MLVCCHATQVMILKIQAITITVYPVSYTHLDVYKRQCSYVLGNSTIKQHVIFYIHCVFQSFFFVLITTPKFILFLLDIYTILWLH